MRLCKIVISNPASGTDGLRYLAKKLATDATLATLTVNQAEGTVSIAITDDATALLGQATYRYDLKVLVPGSASVLLTQGDARVTETSTESIV